MTAHHPTALPESYKSLDELPGYRFGSRGSVESRWVRGSKRHRLADTWHVVKARRNVRRDYLYVTLKTPDGRKHFRVNVLILWAFTGYRPEGLEAAHKDGDRQNNAVGNLAWKTHAENIADKASHGTMRRGGDIPNARLNTESVGRIKRLLVDGSTTYAELGRSFDVSWSTIRAIAEGRTWKHVEVAG